jgi:UDP:flavonoid glycosyltransferase YjiC (YdhE family)
MARAGGAPWQSARFVWESECGGWGVRVLLATTASADHLGLLATFGAACHRFGHDVVVAAPDSLAVAVRRAGFAHAPFADPAAAVRGTVTADIPVLAPHEANVRVMRDVFARIDASAALPGLQALVGAWRPDVIVRETFEYGSYVAAERNDIPHVQVDVVLAWYEELGLSVVEAPLNGLRASVGLGPDLGLVRLRAAPHLTCAPESLEHPAAPGPGDTHRFCMGAADRPAPAVTDWWYGSRAPLVYVSFGPASAGLGLFPDLHRAVVDSLADLPLRVLVSTGGGDPAALGTRPSNVHVERRCDDAEVLPHVAAMVGDGGFSPTLRALAEGVPIVFVPLVADQGYNASRVEAVGAGLALANRPPAGRRELAVGVARVVADPSFRAAARRVALEMRALPDVAEAVPVIADLARSGR